jgi:acyl-CoA dehydrogenase
MIDFDLSPELQAHQEAIKTWAREKAWPLARQADRDHHVPANAMDILDTCPVPLDRIDSGAQGLPDYAEETLVRDVALWEANMYGDAWLFETMSRGIGYLMAKIIGTPDQVAKWYQPIAGPGGGATGFGMTEPGTGSDTSGLMTTARRDGDTWVLNGAKMYCSRGAEAEYIVVLASVDRSLKHKGVRAFVVERDTPGLIITRPNESKLGLRSWVTTALSLDNCVSFNYTRPLVTLQACATARAALDYATEKLLARKDRFVTRRWERIEEELEQMDAALERARRFAYNAIWLDAKNIPNRIEAASAKAFGPPTGEKVIRRCLQLLGPEGASEEMLLEKWYRDAKIFDIFEGTGQIMRRTVARLMMGREAAS